MNLLRQALVKIPLLPFSLALEKWRWNVMAGRIKPEHYNSAWWDLKLEYQGNNSYCYNFVKVININLTIIVWKIFKKVLFHLSRDQKKILTQLVNITSLATLLTSGINLINWLNRLLCLRLFKLVRYFLSGVLQVQIFGALCDASKQGPRFGKPLNQCDIYGSTEAGNRLRSLNLNIDYLWNVSRLNFQTFI